MLFLGLGTGMGSALIVDGIVAPMELAHLPFKKGKTYEDYVGARGLRLPADWPKKARGIRFVRILVNHSLAAPGTQGSFGQAFWGTHVVCPIFLLR